MVQLAADMLEYACRNAQPPGLRQALKASGDIDSIAIEVATLDHHVAEVDPNPEDNSAVVGDVTVSRVHRFLQLHRAIDRVNRAGELHQDAIAHDLDDSAVVICDSGLQDFCTPFLKHG